MNCYCNKENIADIEDCSDKQYASFTLEGLSTTRYTKCFGWHRNKAETKHLFVIFNFKMAVSVDKYTA